MGETTGQHSNAGDGGLALGRGWRSQTRPSCCCRGCRLLAQPGSRLLRWRTLGPLARPLGPGPAAASLRSTPGRHGRLDRRHHDRRHHDRRRPASGPGRPARPASRHLPAQAPPQLPLTPVTAAFGPAQAAAAAAARSKEHEAAARGHSLAAAAQNEKGEAAGCAVASRAALRAPGRRCCCLPCRMSGMSSPRARRSSPHLPSRLPPS